MFVRMPVWRENWMAIPTIYRCVNMAGIKMQSHSWQTNNKTDLSLNRIEKKKAAEWKRTYGGVERSCRNCWFTTVQLTLIAIKVKCSIPHCFFVFFYVGPFSSQGSILLTFCIGFKRRISSTRVDRIANRNLRRLPESEETRRVRPTHQRRLFLLLLLF